MSKVTFTISMDEKFAEKFIGFLKNLSIVNSDKNPPIEVESVTVDGEENPEYVAVPKEPDSDRQIG